MELEKNIYDKVVGNVQLPLPNGLRAGSQTDNITIDANGNLVLNGSAGLSDIVAVTALPTTIGAKRQLLYIINSNFPNGSDRTMYITISSAATVKLYTNQLRMI